MTGLPIEVLNWLVLAGFGITSWFVTRLVARIERAVENLETRVAHAEIALTWQQARVDSLKCEKRATPRPAPIT